ncbi:magnesium transporter protection protein MgtU [Pantoea sp. NGS-ED-1003]
MKRRGLDRAFIGVALIAIALILLTVIVR